LTTRRLQLPGALGPSGEIEANRGGSGSQGLGPSGELETNWASSSGSFSKSNRSEQTYPD